MSEIILQRDQIKNFLVNRSFFTKKAKNLEEYFDRFKCIQTDPIVYIAKSHELSLWNRVESFTRKTLEHELYTNRSLIEYWMQLYSILPIKDRPLLTARMDVRGSWQEKFYNDHIEEIEMTRSYIKAKGPTLASDLKHIPQTRSITEWSSNVSNKATLDYLWDCGEITVSHRDKNKKYYDLTERLIPKKFLGSADNETSLEYFVRSNFAYLGVVRHGIIWKSGGCIKDELYRKFDEMLEKGVITKIKIDGIKTKYYVLTDDIPLIQSSGKKCEHNGLTIIPPFDPLITDRRILTDFFDYDFKWQFYWPASKRTFNPYGMPILYRGEIVGEIGLNKENDHKRLYMTELDSIVETPEFRKELADTVEAMERFVFDY